MTCNHPGCNCVSAEAYNALLDAIRVLQNVSPVPAPVPAWSSQALYEVLCVCKAWERVRPDEKSTVPGDTWDILVKALDVLAARYPQKHA
jgi:hypothetical protein